MKSVASHRAWRPTLMVLLVAGLALIGLGLRGAGWADRGTIVGSAALDVPGAPPWTVELAAPAAGARYLLESTITATGSTRHDITAAPELRVKQADGERLSSALERAEAGATLSRGSTVEITNHWWFQPPRAGDYSFELVTLNATAEVQPNQWRLRLAENVPGSGGEGPGPLPLVGFGLAAVAFLLLVAGPRGKP